jgi:8-oxo-dGTP pyrophosphatase MutT (NUDIX family)
MGISVSDREAPAFTVHPLTGIEARVEPFDWPFARENLGEIETVWARETADKPGLFNGEVLIQHRGSLDGTIFRAGYSPTHYKPFLAWNRLGCPGVPVRNGFAMAALRARDGAFLLGVMAPGTANAGKIYFAAGTPDQNDVLPDGRVDLEGSVLRELTEETGLAASEITIGDGWTGIVGASRVAFMRPVGIDLNANEARALILDRMKGLSEEELADIHIVREPGDIDVERMPPFQVAFLEHAFKTGR